MQHTLQDHSLTLVGENVCAMPVPQHAIKSDVLFSHHGNMICCTHCWLNCALSLSVISLLAALESWL